MHVVICGAGVIGAALAFQLSRQGIAVTIVERWRVAGAASGKSGGFLALDWCDGTPVAALARRSFELHEAWAAELGNTYGYRHVDTIGAAVSRGRPLRTGGNAHLAPWLAPEVTHRRQLGTTATTAQLDPAGFTRALVDAAVHRGGKLLIGAVAGVTRSERGARVTGVVLENGERVEADAVVLALGPWSLLAAQWVPLPAIYGLKGHSIVFRPKEPLPAEAIFAEVQDAAGETLAPEIVPRADGTLYVCGVPGSGPLPVDPAHVRPEDGGCEKLREIAIHLVPQLATAEVLAEQACYRPIAEDGLPVIGPVAGSDGLYVATGHSVWGMLNAPGTAEALAGLMTAGRSPHIDLAAFSPARLEPLDPSSLQLVRS
jgi:glycine/D-amino acid oxidase-like deaminating enzyme